MIRAVCSSGPLNGTLRLPGDKSISHRYAMLAAIAAGDSQLHGFGSGRDCRSTLGCLRGLGVEIRHEGDRVCVGGRGLDGLRASAGPLDAGNSGTTVRLLAGILAGQGFETVLTGDESLSRRPMERIIQPLRLMGAQVEGRHGGLLPLSIRGGKLKGLRYELPVASAQVKSCVLLAGLYGDAPTSVREKVATRDHTEIALRHFGAHLDEREGWITVEPRPALRGRRLEIPADLSSAAFFIVAAAVVPGSEIIFRGVGLNRRRRALLTFLRVAGLEISVENESESGGEPRGDLRVRYDASFLDGELPQIYGDRVAALIDEIPVLAVLGTQVRGGLVVSDAQELRHKESDRLAALAANLRAMGAEVEESAAGIRIRGGRRLSGAEVESRGDHRIAMAFAVAGLVAGGETRIREAECAEVSFPGFWETLASLGASVTGEP